MVAENRGPGRVAYPRAWVTQQALLRKMAILCGAAAVLCLVMGFVGSELFLVAAGVSIAAGIGLPLAFAGWTRAGSDGAVVSALRTGRLALVARASGGRIAILVATLGILGLFYTFLSLNREALRGRYDDSSGGGRFELPSRVILELSPFVVATVVLLIAFFFLGKRRTLGVGMDVKGVYHWWWGGCSFYPWDRLVGVRLMVPQAGPRIELVASDLAAEANPEENWLGRMVWMRRRQRKVQLALFRVHPGVVYQALCFYIRNPDKRDELGDERALGRMQSGEYGEIVDEIRRYGRALNPGESAPK